MADFSKLLKHRVLLIAGSEDLLRHEALEGLLKAANVQPDDFDLETFSGDTSAPMDWVASAGTAPFLGERRVAIVRHLLRFDLERAKSLPFSELAETSLLILVADEEGGSEDRERKAQSVTKQWAKSVEAGGGAVVSADIDSSAVKAALKARAQSRGKELSGRAIDLLAEMTGGSLSRAIAELEKLELFVGDQPSIREADVRRVVAPSREWNVYRMVDGIFSGDVGEALRQLRVLVGSSTRAEDAAFSRILPQVSRQLRQLWQGRLCVEHQCGPGNAPASVKALFPERGSLATEQPYRQNATMSVARKVSFARLNRCFAILADTDARLKGALDGFSSVETLERMLLEMAQS